MAQLKLFCITVVVVFFALVLPRCFALKCHECGLCVDGEKGSKVECGLGTDVCMKITLGEHSIKKCAYRSLCVNGDVELDFSDHAKSFFKGWVADTMDTERENTVEQLVHCCKTDYCNSASAPATALMLLVAPVVLAALMG